MTRSPEDLSTPGALTYGRFFIGLAASGVLLVWTVYVCLAVLGMLMPGGQLTAVGSGSMAPAFDVGDVVVVQRPDLPAGEYLRPPTVVLVDRPGQVPLLHRVVSHEPGRGYTTKGDANLSEDTEVAPPEAIIGTGFLVIPMVGYPTTWHARGEHLSLVLAGLLIVGLGMAARWGWTDEHDPWSHCRTDTTNPSTTSDVGEMPNAPDTLDVAGSHSELADVGEVHVVGQVAS